MFTEADNQDVAIHGHHRNAKGLGKNQRHMLAFMRRHPGLHTIAKDESTQSAAYGLIWRGLIARPNAQNSLGYVNQVFLVPSTTLRGYSE